MPSFKVVALSLLSAVSFVAAQDGYTGYNLTVEGDGVSTEYATDNGATSNTSTLDPPPDVYLNASVHVGEIDIEVDNLTASINLEAQVLSLLSFNAGVELSIDRVALTIQNISAQVILEARLQNLVLMISDVLDSIDLNPVIAELASGVGSVINDTTSALTGDSDSTLQTRSIEIQHNVLYSVNDYSGNTHTNRMLSQNGTIVDVYLHNDGVTYNTKVVGSYLKDMSFNGHNTSTTFRGQEAFDQEYTYSPFPGLSVVSAIYTELSGKVIGTQVLAESRAGGTSTVLEENETES